MKIENQLTLRYKTVWETISQEEMSVASTPQEVIEEVMSADKDLESKLVALEMFLAIAEESVGTRATGICRHNAQALESYSPGILPSRYPVNSFTLAPSLTNRNVALEAVDGKLIAIIGAIFAAIIGLIMKLGGWGQSKSELITNKIDKAAEPLSQTEKETASKVKVRFEEFEEVGDTTGKKYTLKSLQEALLDNYFGEAASALSGYDLWVLQGVLKQDSNSKAIKAYEQVNKLIYVLLSHARLLLTSIHKFGKEIKKPSFRQIEVDVELGIVIDKLQEATIVMTRNCMNDIVTTMKRAGATYDWNKISPNKIDPADPAAHKQALSEFFREFHAKRKEWFKEAEGVSASDFPPDLFTDLDKYTDRVVKAASSSAFDTSQWSKELNEKESKKSAKYLEDVEANILKSTKHFDLEDVDGTHMAPNFKRIAPTLRNSIEAYQMMLRLVAGCINMIDDGANVLVTYRTAFVPAVLRTSRDFKEAYDKYLAEE